MAVLQSQSSISQVIAGNRTERATATVAADQDLFSIDGGNVLLLGLWGEVTVAIGAGSQDLELDFDPDDGGANVALSTTLLVDADPTGTLYTLNTTAGGALVATTDVAYNAILATPILLTPGDIVLDVTGTEAGSVKWTALWIAAEDGGSLTAV